MKWCKNQSKRNGRTYCRTYHDYPKDGKCSIRCNRMIPTFWWKLKVVLERRCK
ncbi:MAG: hypothetical protein J6A61_05965 [Clostridia bacterium]|nr:hypothetical protein [Clostridia bacterium]